jgi:predicted Zn-ribbon and HTH transcriptional regulator
MTDEPALKPLREALEQVRDRLDSIIARLRSREEVRCLRWRCNTCGHMKNFTCPMPVHVAPPCPKCKGVNFQAMP